MLGFSEEELPEVGVFCTDSPHRPNPIALTITELSERNGRFLKVKNLDLFDKTPVLDIKPYTPSRLIQKIKLPGWYQKILKKQGLNIYESETFKFHKQSVHLCI
jgi:tRNA (Thr-GGU) A37 N-methylase